MSNVKRGGKESAEQVIKRLKSQSPKAVKTESPPQGGNFDDYASGVSMTLVIVALFVYLTLVIAKGNATELLDALKTERDLGRFMLAFVLLNVLLGFGGKIGHGLFYLIVVSSLLTIGPDAVENANKMIKNLFD